MSFFFKDFKMKNKKILSFLLAAVLIFPYSASLFAKQSVKTQIDELKNNPDFYEIDPNSIEVQYLGEIPDQELVRGVNETVADVNQTIGEINQGIDQFNQGIQQANQIIDTLNNIINLAKKVWQIVDDSKPVANVRTLYATALPYNMKAAQLQGWSKPRSYRYGFYVKNLYGIKTVDVTYKVSFQYGGNYKGKGRYLTAVTVIPENVDTMIGYSFFMNASVPDSTLVNVGTYENPIAALRLVLQWRISTIIKDSQATAVYYITGDGKFQQIADPFKTISRSPADAPSAVQDNAEIPAVPVQMPKVNIDSNQKNLPVKSLPASLKKDPANIF